jgi:dephospho-CoA kinase
LSAEIKFPHGIGITGGTGSGKSTAAEILRRLGFFVGDADSYAKKAVAQESAGLRAIREEFCETFFTGESLDRKKLGRHIYENEAAKKRLESIVHPIIHEMLLKDVQKLDKQSIWFYDAALLYEANTANQFKEIWLIARDEDLRIQAICNRDKISTDVAKKRIQAQMPQQEKVKRANVVLWNNGSIQSLEDLLVKALSNAQISIPKT